MCDPFSDSAGRLVESDEVGDSSMVFDDWRPLSIVLPMVVCDNQSCAAFDAWGLVTHRGGTTCVKLWDKKTETRQDDAKERGGRGYCNKGSRNEEEKRRRISCNRRREPMTSCVIPDARVGPHWL
jgi:hypothetical protein